MKTTKKEINRFKELLEKTKAEPAPIRYTRYFFGGMVFFTVLAMAGIILSKLVLSAPYVIHYSFM